MARLLDRLVLVWRGGMHTSKKAAGNITSGRGSFLFDFVSLSTRTQGPHGGVVHRTCRRANKHELPAARVGDRVATLQLGRLVFPPGTSKAGATYSVRLATRSILPFNLTPMGASSISPAHLHVRPIMGVHRTCRRADEIEINTQYPKNMRWTAFFRAQGYAAKYLANTSSCWWQVDDRDGMEFGISGNG